jgi:hypothetical protein
MRLRSWIISCAALPTTMRAKQLVRYWLTVGAERWTDFPIPGAKWFGSIEIPTGRTTSYTTSRRKRPRLATNRWAAVTRGAPLIGGADEVTNQELTYGLVAADEIELSGRIKANLIFRSNEVDRHVIARPPGREQPLSPAIARRRFCTTYAAVSWMRDRAPDIARNTNLPAFGLWD